MKPPRKRIDEFEAFLFSAYRAREERAPDESWRERVMSEIGRRSVPAAEGNDQALFGRFAWRFAAAACAISAVLLVYIFSNGIVNYEELAMKFLENPIDFLI